MARVEFDSNGMHFRGGIGNGVFRKVGKQTILSSRPGRKNKKKKPTPKQEAVHDRTREASFYGQEACADPELRPIYEAIARKEGKPLISMANRDAYRAPVVDDIDLSNYSGQPGDVIAIAASDDTGVVRVDVRVTDPDGSVLEQGTATAGMRGRWIYAAQTSVREGTAVHVEATAMDRPHQTGTASAEIVVKRGVSSADGPERRNASRGGTTSLRDRIDSMISDSISPDATSPGVISNPISPDTTSPDVISDSISPDTISPGVISDSISPGVGSILDPARLLQDARARAGLSQRQLAHRAGTPQAVISRIEQGQTSPAVETLVRILRSAGFDAVVELRPTESSLP